MVSIRLSERDRRVIAKCAVAKWLSTTQLTRLYFSGVTPDAVRKSLRRLVDAGFLSSHREHQMAQALFGLGPKGKLLLEAKDMPAEVCRTPPRQIEHMIGINDLRVAVESNPSKVAYFFASWELQNLGWLHTVIPDAALGLKTPLRRTFLFEYDRGSETLSTLIAKLRTYDSGLSGVRFSAAVVMADSAARLENLSRQARKEGFFRAVLGCLREELSGGVEGAFFSDLRRLRGEKKPLADYA